jgi:hypothetical protein
MISNLGALMYDLGEDIRENSELANLIFTGIKRHVVGLFRTSTAMEELNTAPSDNRAIGGTIEDRVGHTREKADELVA